MWQEFVDGGEDFGAAGLFLGGGEDVWGLDVEGEEEGLEVEGGVGGVAGFGDLVGFGEEEEVGDLVAGEPGDEFYINVLGEVAGVDEEEGEAEVVTAEEVVFDHGFGPAAFCFGGFCKAVAREVDEVPGVIYEEVVDESCLAGCS